MGEERREEGEEGEEGEERRPSRAAEAEDRRKRRNLDDESARMSSHHPAVHILKRYII